MGREIKFRAFDPKNGMIEPYAVRNGKAFIIKRCNKDDPTVTVDGVNFYCNWDIDVATDFPVMQYTGLKDKNGVEIYEGDIVKMFYQDWLDKTETIKFQDGTFGYGGDFHFSAFNCLAQDMRDAKYHFSHAFEVIGNIYQHPELLK